MSRIFEQFTPVSIRPTFQVIIWYIFEREGVQAKSFASVEAPFYVNEHLTYSAKKQSSEAKNLLKSAYKGEPVHLHTTNLNPNVNFRSDFGAFKNNIIKSGSKRKIFDSKH